MEFMRVMFVSVFARNLRLNLFVRVVNNVAQFSNVEKTLRLVSVAGPAALRLVSIASDLKYSVARTQTPGQPGLLHPDVVIHFPSRRFVSLQMRTWDPGAAVFNLI